MMSKFIVCVVRDQAVDAFVGPLFIAANKGTAIRMFCDAVSDVNSQMYKHKVDFFLFQVGIWNDEDGVLTGVIPDRLFWAKDVNGV